MNAAWPRLEGGRERDEGGVRRGEEEVGRWGDAGARKESKRRLGRNI